MLPPIFSSLGDLGAPLVHYKICSTFDSTSNVGSIGRAIDIASSVFETNPVPVVPASPPLGRCVVFGNMFAADVDGVYRLDRHPTMRDHPVTPMDESDLRRHLGKQTERSIALVDIRSLRDGVDPATDHFDETLGDDPGIVFFDSLDETDARTVVGVIWTKYVENTVIPENNGTDALDAEAGVGIRSSLSFIVGSSGFQYALADYWKSSGIATESPTFNPLPPVDRTVVMPGSASPLTATQIDAASEAGFAGVRIDTAALVDPTTVDTEYERVISDTLGALDDGDSVVVYAARGPDDDAIAATARRTERLDDPPNDIGRYIAERQGEILRAILRDADLNRVVVAGRDTCDHVVPALDIYALRTRFPIAPGSPLCRAHAKTPRFDGLEIALKGGRLGNDRFFIRARDRAED